MYSRFFAIIGASAFYVVPIGVVSLLVFLWFNANLFAAVDSSSTEILPFIVTKGLTETTLAQKLEKEGFIKNWRSVWLIGKFKDDDSGSGLIKKIKIGEYRLSRSYSPKRIINALIDGEVIYHEVEIKPGSRVSDIAPLIAATGLVSLTDAEVSLRDMNLMSELRLPAGTFEGYIYPDTYKFTRPVEAKNMVEEMVARGKQEREKAIGGWVERALDLGFSIHQILTLASILEKQASSQADKNTLSSVYHNRLRIGMPLQSDIALEYGIPGFTGSATAEQRNLPGPYNTYLNTGLPPTPICNPSIESIRAALFPEDTDYLYFMKKADGSHEFFTTYKEFLEKSKDSVDKAPEPVVATP